MWTIAKQEISSHLLLGTAAYPNPQLMLDSIAASRTSIITISLRRQQPNSKGGDKFWQLIKNLNCHILPNTAGCYTVKEAITTAHMAREIFKTNWLKLEIIGDDYTLQPNTIALLEATRELIKEGFEVFPYTTDDLVIAQKLVDLGCNIVMPLGSPIGSGQGLLNIYALETLRHRLPDTKLIIDAGIGKPSDATQAMEIGYDGVLLNSAVALAHNPVVMAESFKHAIIAGHKAYSAGIMPVKSFAVPTTPDIGKPFWHDNT